MRGFGMIWLFLAVSLRPLQAQKVGSEQLISDSVRVAIDSLVASRGSFEGSYTAGDFTGDRGGFDLLFRLSERRVDSVLTALVDCFTDSTVTHAQYRHANLSRGGLCYLALHSIVYRETDPEEDWPGNYFEFPDRAHLRAAQKAWREAVKNHWYNVL